MVVSAPVGQGADLLPVSRLITFGDKTHHCSVIRILHNDVGVASGRAVVAKKPFKVELVGGKKQPFCDGKKDIWLCGCKHTSNPSYCDGTHKQDFIVSAPLHEPAES
uniref:Iron-binding zinc finger CDGSH type domain-containing protein n=1 Tax=Haplochromis burtoni TaxID=8153 RepID=A0A3Q2WAJ1_HAPBU